MASGLLTEDGQKSLSQRLECRLYTLMVSLQPAWASLLVSIQDIPKQRSCE